MLNITNHEGNATQAHNEGVPWQFSALRVCTPTAGGMDQSMVKELRSCMLLPAAKKCYTTTLYLSEWLLPKRQRTINVGKDVEKRKNSCTVGGNVIWCSYYEKQYGASSKKLKLELPYNPSISFHSWIFIQRK